MVLTGEALGNLLAPVNAGLNALSALLLLAGYVFIRKGDPESHRRVMLGAVGASALFLLLYLTRYALTGTHRFAGEGVAKGVYLGILFSHMILAAAVVPMVLRLLYLAFTGRTSDHQRLARWTFPIWMYVSLTGLLVYALLYHVFGYL
jgi:putative membrane protein